MTEAEEHAALNAMAEDMVKVARHLAQQYGLDGCGAAMATGFAMTKMLFRDAPNSAAALRAAKIASDSNVRSMADMVAGGDAHPVMQ